MRKTPAITASPRHGRALAHRRLTILQPANQNPGFAGKGTECDSSKDTLGSHGIPLRTQLAGFFFLPPQRKSTLPLLFSPPPSAVPTPDSRAIFPNPKHLIEQLGFLTCGLICSLNTWLIQKSRNSRGFFFSPLLPLILGIGVRGGRQPYRV